MPKLLSKSSYLLGLQCPKLLWVKINDKRRLPEPDELAQKKFDDGHVVGELAKKVFPEGENIPDENFKENLENTKKLIKKRIPLFEPAFMVDNLYSRADILVPVGKDEWDIIEVKSATKVKDVNLHDVSFQKYIYEKYGLKIRKCFLMHINNQYCLNGQIEPKELFIQTEITENIKEFSKYVESNIEEMIKVINSQEEPTCNISPSCADPYDCPIKDECWDEVPENSIFDFYRMLKKKCFELYNGGIVCLTDVPESTKLNEKQQIQRRLAHDGGKHIDKTEINNFLRNLEYPIYYLDFETINPILPKFDGMNPYQRIPFQFSLHIQKEEGGEVEHISFLADGTDDPRPKFMQSLRDNLGDSGSILVYNQGFEKGVMNESATAFPEFREWYDENILSRIKDLWDVFRNFHYYDPKQCGSASIKAVLPVMSDLSYKNLKDVKKGDQASYEYERVTYDSSVSEEERQKIRDALEKYCELDTLAEVEIVKGLQNELK